MKFITPTKVFFFLFVTPGSLKSTANYFPINLKLCEIIGTEVFAFSHSCDLESRSRSIRLVQNVEYNSIYLHVKFESNRFINVRMHANVKVFDAVSNTAVISLVSLNLN